MPAVARLYTKKTGKPAPPPIPVKKPTMDELRKAGQNRAYIDVPGYDIDQAIPREERAAADARDVVFHEEAKRLGITDIDSYLKSRRAQARDWPRAADLESPAPRGHYLREFGQSDRDLIDNANTDASMPQALVLMNSELFQSILQTNTQLRLNLADRRRCRCSRSGQIAVRCKRCGGASAPFYTAFSDVCQFVKCMYEIQK